MKYLIYIGTIVLSIFVGMLISAEFPTNFYDFNFIQLLTPIMQLFIAIGLALFVNIKLSNTNKRNEIMAELLSEYKSILDTLHKTAVKYMEEKKPDLETKILSLLTEANQHLKTITQIKHEYSIISKYSNEDMQSDIFTYKSRLTEKSFKQQDAYDPMQKKAVISAYYSISQKIIEAKVELYK